MVLAVSGLVFALVLVLLVFIFAIPNLTSSGKVQPQLGPERFDAGTATARAAEVAERGPFLLPDVAGNDRDVFIQHLGPDPYDGWLAFAARQTGASRNCTLEWQTERSEFVDPCDGATINANGDGLTQFSAEVSDTGEVIVDFRSGS
jgi:hypothetical protein